jgi:hypothetical protein
MSLNWYFDCLVYFRRIIVDIVGEFSTDFILTILGKLKRDWKFSIGRVVV